MENATILFAIEELKKYIKKMTNQEVVVGNTEGQIVLGVSENYSELDDKIEITIENGKGTIKGSNPRSVLLGVYRFLSENGCVFARPGAGGESIPTCNVNQLNCFVNESASYRHRGACIEGADSFENVRDYIDWLPKNGFNSYYLQFIEPHTFFERWYNHEQNPKLKGENHPFEKTQEFSKILRAEIKKRSLLLHAMGHGWTSVAIGLPALGWQSHDGELSEKQISMLAEVNGKRELWGNVALNTQLCYSNPEVQERMVSAIVDYVAANPDVDILHFWLADDGHNQCECPMCRDTLPSEFYVSMLNEIDRRLEEIGSSARIVFLIYLDLLWPSKLQKIKNIDRFILMFAPISRTYTKPYVTDKTLPKIPNFIRNKTMYPKNIEENLAFLKEWQSAFSGDSFVYDYHFMWEHILDIGHYSLTDILCQDIKKLEEIGLNGYISCQPIRVFLPSGFGNYALGKLLWNKEIDPLSLEENYFSGVFGADWRSCKEYIASISAPPLIAYLRGEIPILNSEMKNKLTIALEEIASFETVIKRNENGGNINWKYLQIHYQYATMFLKGLSLIAGGDLENGRAELWEAIEYMRENELLIQPVFDVFEMATTLEGFFKRLDSFEKACSESVSKSV